MKFMHLGWGCLSLLLWANEPLPAASAPINRKPTAGEQMLATSLAVRTTELEKRCLAEVQSAQDWERLQPLYRQQLFEMLGLDPLPPRGDLKAVVTGKTERGDFLVENLHFQSLPGLYVTANLYRPRTVTGPLPAILYLSGHGPVISNGVSYGNKVTYQHHGAWFARNGYLCLVLDTLQLGEIQGLHHGTYREGMWWWNSRGYTPAGVEAWNSIRALDYLQTRPEVDMTRVGATGRSGGGAYSWWIAALDDRIRAAAPVAGITDLRNHVIDGTVEGHCDCMFTVNTYAWDYAQVAALVAPRPLLIVNSDADAIFPLDGVVRTHAQVRRIYQLLNVPDRLGLVIGPGPHKDTQDLQVPVFRWFNRYLKQNEPLVETAAVKFFTPAELKVFSSLPSEALNSQIHSQFVAAASLPPLPKNALEWKKQSASWREALREKTFRGWPESPPPLALKPAFSRTRENVRFAAWDLASEQAIELRVYLAQPEDLRKAEKLVVQVLNGEVGPDAEAGSFVRWLACWQAGFAQELTEELRVNQTYGAAGLAPDPEAFAVVRRQVLEKRQSLAWIALRGVGLSAWKNEPKSETHLRRRFMLLGQTLEGMRVWDLRRSLQALRSLPGLGDVPVTLRAEGALAGDALYAAILEPEPDVRFLELKKLPESHAQGPDFLNVLRILDMPQTLAMTLEHCTVRLQDTRADAWNYPKEVMARLGWDARRLVIEKH